ncbi:MAG: SAM-dependent methyltransferase [Nonlabens sp.]
MKTGRLYLIPVPLGSQNPAAVLPASIYSAVNEIDYYVVENEKTARRFIKQIQPEKNQSSLHIELLNKHTGAIDVPRLLEPCKAGMNVGVMSEAGVPGVADPGAAIVRIAHQMRIQVAPLVGPSSILLAMMASGMNGQSFAFNGYLPMDARERKKSIKSYESRARNLEQAQIFIETPYRNNKLLNELIGTLSPDTLLCVATDLTLDTEYIKCTTTALWKNEFIDLHKRPTIFIIGS